MGAGRHLLHVQNIVPERLLVVAGEEVSVAPPGDGSLFCNSVLRPHSFITITENFQGHSINLVKQGKCSIKINWSKENLLSCDMKGPVDV